MKSLNFPWKELAPAFVPDNSINDQLAISKAEAKRERKALKRFRDEKRRQIGIDLAKCRIETTGVLV